VPKHYTPSNDSPDLPKMEKDGEFTTVHLDPDGTLFFSYRILIGFRRDDTTVTRQNLWSATTEQHLAGLDGGNVLSIKRRLTTEEFVKAYRRAFPPRHKPRKKPSLQQADGPDRPSSNL
jgi:hypothetical protein